MMGLVESIKVGFAEKAKADIVLQSGSVEDNYYVEYSVIDSLRVSFEDVIYCLLDNGIIDDEERADLMEWWAEEFTHGGQYLLTYDDMSGEDTRLIRIVTKEDSWYIHNTYKKMCDIMCCADTTFKDVAAMLHGLQLQIKDDKLERKISSNAYTLLSTFIAYEVGKRM